MVDEEQSDRISRNVMIDRKLDDYIESKRIKNKGTEYEFMCSRSDTWNYFVSMGVFFGKIADDIGETEFEKLKALLKKLNLKKIDLSKII